MRFPAISKILLILIFPFLIFLGAASQIAFDKPYYAGKIIEYKINIPGANSLNERTIDFVSGKNNKLPDAYSEREKQHLIDVRNAVKTSRIAFYSFILLSIALFLASAFIIKFNNNLASFTGKVLAYGGVLAIGLAALLFALISLDFTSAFESFHRLFFQQGTYTFDPAKEIIVRLYPEELFTDLGLRISRWVFFLSAISAIIGMFLVVKSKSRKSKISGSLKIRKIFK